MKRLKKIYITPEEMNSVLAWCDSRRKFYRPINQYDTMTSAAFIDDKRVELQVTAKYHGETAIWCTRKDEKEVYSTITGLDAFMLLQRDYINRMNEPIPNWKKELGEQATAEAILAYRKDTDHKRYLAYGYDLNGAYNWGLAQPMPDTRELVGERRIVKEGEIGFYITDWEVNPPRAKGLFNWAGITDQAIYLAYPGDWGRWIFKEQESPFADYAHRWQERKLNAKDPFEKQKAKDMTNFAVGFLQRKNPFLRATVIERINKKILDAIDEHTIYCNTDSIISETRRDDLPIGISSGEWKEEHIEEPFAHVGFSYQWREEVSYRGIPKSWFDEGFDILEDEIPGEEKNIWYYDIWKNRLRRQL